MAPTAANMSQGDVCKAVISSEATWKIREDLPFFDARLIVDTCAQYVASSFQVRAANGESCLIGENMPLPTMSLFASDSGDDGASSRAVSKAVGTAEGESAQEAAAGKGGPMARQTTPGAGPAILPTTPGGAKAASGGDSPKKKTVKMTIPLGGAEETSAEQKPGEQKPPPTAEKPPSARKQTSRTPRGGGSRGSNRHQGQERAPPLQQAMTAHAHSYSGVERLILELVPRCVALREQLRQTVQPICYDGVVGCGLVDDTSIDYEVDRFLRARLVVCDLSDLLSHNCFDEYGEAADEGLGKSLNRRRSVQKDMFDVSSSAVSKRRESAQMVMQKEDAGLAAEDAVFFSEEAMEQGRGRFELRFWRAFTTGLGRAIFGTERGDLVQSFEASANEVFQRYEGELQLAMNSLMGLLPSWISDSLFVAFVGLHAGVAVRQRPEKFAFLHRCIRSLIHSSGRYIFVSTPGWYLPSVTWMPVLSRKELLRSRPGEVGLSLRAVWPAACLDPNTCVQAINDVWGGRIPGKRGALQFLTGAEPLGRWVLRMTLGCERLVSLCMEVARESAEELEKVYDLVAGELREAVERHLDHSLDDTPPVTLLEAAAQNVARLAEERKKKKAMEKRASRESRSSSGPKTMGKRVSILHNADRHFVPGFLKHSAGNDPSFDPRASLQSTQHGALKSTWSDNTYSRQSQSQQRKTLMGDSSSGGSRKSMRGVSGSSGRCSNGSILAQHGIGASRHSSGQILRGGLNGLGVRGSLSSLPGGIGLQLGVGASLGEEAQKQQNGEEGFTSSESESDDEPEAKLDPFSGSSLLVKLHADAHGLAQHIQDGSCRLRRFITTGEGENAIEWPIGQPGAFGGRIPIHNSPELKPTCAPPIVEDTFRLDGDEMTEQPVAKRESTSILSVTPLSPKTSPKTSEVKKKGASGPGALTLPHGVLQGPAKRENTGKAERRGSKSPTSPAAPGQEAAAVPAAYPQKAKAAALPLVPKPPSSQPPADGRSRMARRISSRSQKKNMMQEQSEAGSEADPLSSIAFKPELLGRCSSAPLLSMPEDFSAALERILAGANKSSAARARKESKGEKAGSGEGKDKDKDEDCVECRPRRHVPPEYHIRAESAFARFDTTDYDCGDPLKNSVLVIALQDTIRKALMSSCSTDGPLHIAWRHHHNAEELKDLRRAQLAFGVLMLFSAWRAPLPTWGEMPLDYFSCHNNNLKGDGKGNGEQSCPKVHLPDGVYTTGCTPLFHCMASEVSSRVAPLVSSAFRVGVPHAFLEERPLREALTVKAKKGRKKWAEGSLLTLLTAFASMEAHHVGQDWATPHGWMQQDHRSFFSLLCVFKLVMGLEYVMLWHEEIPAAKDTRLEHFMPWLRGTKSKVRNQSVKLDLNADDEKTGQPVLISPWVVTTAKAHKACLTTTNWHNWKPCQRYAGMESEAASLESFAAWLKGVQPNRLVWSSRFSDIGDVYMRLENSIVIVAFVRPEGERGTTAREIFDLYFRSVGQPKWFGVQTVSFMIYSTKYDYKIDQQMGTHSVLTIGEGESFDCLMGQRQLKVRSGSEIVVCSAYCFEAFLGSAKDSVTKHPEMFKEELDKLALEERMLYQRVNGEAPPEKVRPPLKELLAAGTGRDAAKKRAARNSRQKNPKPQHLTLNFDVLKSLLSHVHQQTQKFFHMCWVIQKLEEQREVDGHSSWLQEKEAELYAKLDGEEDAAQPVQVDRRKGKRRPADHKHTLPSMVLLDDDSPEQLNSAMEAIFAHAEEDDGIYVPAHVRRVTVRGDSPEPTSRRLSWRPPSPHPSKNRDKGGGSGDGSGAGKSGGLIGGLKSMKEPELPPDFLGVGTAWRPIVAKHAHDHHHHHHHGARH
eukprot:TRINITY_DN79981_c0_g1_i1.p1 TRINITY_DN79981_c0_g1~~TRINITY_DN79981_c0_g1_i1.p1  ORF type:complete len:1853 (-),score=472.00 TRINITY_DN79981_c0_g1_i1:142-5700(-)